MSGSARTYYADLKARAIRERPFALVLVEPSLIKRTNLKPYALVFKSANQALICWVLTWLFWCGLAVTFTVHAFGVTTNPPIVLLWMTPAAMAGILRFTSERVDVPEDSSVGTKLDHALVICRIGPTIIYSVWALAVVSIIIYLARELGLRGF